MEWAKPYLGKIKNILTTENPQRVENFVKGAQKFIEMVLKNFDDYLFYLNSEMNQDAMLCFGI